jgi:hypothetical protein
VVRGPRNQSPVDAEPAAPPFIVQPDPARTPIYSIRVEDEDGEVSIVDDVASLACTLEYFDTDDMDRDVRVTDALGRDVRVRVEALVLEVFELRGGSR